MEEWIKILGGGAGGAIITTAVTYFRGRKQSVGYEIDMNKVFYPEVLSDTEITKITFSSTTQTYSFNNLFIATIKVENRGNEDIENFIFGITLSDYIKAVKIETVPQDRHHNILMKNEVDFENPLNEIDFELTPFNKKDSYEIKLYVTISKETIELKDIKFSSPHPIKFKQETSLYRWNSKEKIMEIDA